VSDISDAPPESWNKKRLIDKRKEDDEKRKLEIDWIYGGSVLGRGRSPAVGGVGSERRREAAAARRWMAGSGS
jgi:hypothetical protein